MMKLPAHKSLYAVLIVALVLMVSCKKDPEVVPTTGKIKGTITLLNTDVWTTFQDSGEVQLTIFPEFSLDPPAGWGPVPDGLFGPNVPGGTYAIGAPSNAQNPTVFNYAMGATGGTYELEVDPGTYSALALGFRHNFITDPSLRTATLGVHWGNPTSVSHGIVIKANIAGNVVTLFDYPAPSPITVNAGDELTIDFTADFGFIEDWYR
ncbi:MAG: hypothetical protein HKN76_01705 [Saprospiraceae bacterium]|nr:hypothetical protein [Saprospiraceae bacterium]